MGISIMGIRGIAAAKNDSKQLSVFFSNLFLLHFFSTIIVVILYWILLYCVPYMSSYRDLMYIGLLKLFFSLFLIEWFFKGLEEFRYITIRSILVRLVYVLSVFVFVRSEDDYVLYFFLTSMTVVINASVNFLYAQRYVVFSLESINIKNYIKPFFMLGLYMLLTSMYTSFNVTFLGFVCGDVQVGYYSAAVKLFNVILAFFTALTGVMLPRMSALLEDHQVETFKYSLYKTVDLLFTISIPAFLFTVVMARPIIYLIAGYEYEGAIVPLQVVSALIFIIGYEQILAMQALLPLKKDHTILRISLMGALCGISLNLLLVPLYGCLGSSVCWLVSELLILLLLQKAVTKYLEIYLPLRRFFMVFFAHLLLFPILYFVKFLFDGQIYLQLIIGGILMCLYVLFVQVTFLRNQVLLSLLSKYYRKDI